MQNVPVVRPLRDSVTRPKLVLPVVSALKLPPVPPNATLSEPVVSAPRPVIARLPTPVVNCGMHPSPMHMLSCAPVALAIEFEPIAIFRLPVMDTTGEICCIAPCPIAMFPYPVVIFHPAP